LRAAPRRLPNLSRGRFSNARPRLSGSGENPTWKLCAAPSAAKNCTCKWYDTLTPDKDEYFDLTVELTAFSSFDFKKGEFNLDGNSTYEAPGATLTGGTFPYLWHRNRLGLPTSVALHMPPIPVILNPSAGGGHPDGEEGIRDSFAARGLTADMKVTGGEGGDLTSLVRDCVDAGCPIVVVGGGDGSLHAAAGILAGTETALGILPIGTLNHFAKDLGVPPGIEDAVAVIASGVIRRVDVGEANGRVFINNASLGLYPAVVRQREAIRERLGRSKWPAMALALWRALVRYRLLLVGVQVEEEDLVRRTPFVFIGNNRYTMDGLNIGGRVVLDGGTLSLYMARREGPFSLVLLAFRALVGRLRQARDFEEFTAPSVRVETRRAHEHVGLDGEVVTMKTPIQCRIRPLALRVVVPSA